MDRESEDSLEVVEVTSWKVEWWDTSERETVKKASISENTHEKGDSKRLVERKNFRKDFLSLIITDSAV